MPGLSPEEELDFARFFHGPGATGYKPVYQPREPGPGDPETYEDLQSAELDSITKPLPWLPDIQIGHENGEEQINWSQKREFIV